VTETWRFKLSESSATGVPLTPQISMDLGISGMGGLGIKTVDPCFHFLQAGTHSLIQFITFCVDRKITIQHGSNNSHHSRSYCHNSTSDCHCSTPAAKTNVSICSMITFDLVTYISVTHWQVGSSASSSSVGIVSVYRIYATQAGSVQ
jgi:hypothetical protein